MKTYKPKDLGYKRTQSKAKVRVTFGCGEVWEVPVQVIADNRDEEYKDEEEDTIRFINEGGLSDYDLTDWAKNNMNWSDLSPYARKLPTPPKEIDYEEQWSDAEIEVTEL